MWIANFQEGLIGKGKCSSTSQFFFMLKVSCLVEMLNKNDSLHMKGTNLFIEKKSKPPAMETDLLSHQTDRSPQKILVLSFIERSLCPWNRKGQPWSEGRPLSSFYGRPVKQDLSTEIRYLCLKPLGNDKETFFSAREFLSTVTRVGAWRIFP